MEFPRILKDFPSLPPEAQKQVLDFMAFIKARYTPAEKRKVRRSKLASEPFIGMWRGRYEMSDSVKWVREVRKREWGAKS